MKIKHLRFKNLNSLAGEWSIDFMAPEYIADGIFAISGPTGAGKSTILDAICLALYGCTPRLENISASTNELMSRQTGDCFSEVVFETLEGSFRANWSQRRAKGKAGGALQQSRHEISKEGTGEILASQLRKTADVIEEKTGMDFKRFTQSMMLAQGGVAAFLKANGNERAPILEQITGTEIYSQISMHVYQQQKAHKETLERLRAESCGIVLMSSGEEENTRQDLEAKNAHVKVVEGKAEKLEASVKWLQRIADLKTEVSNIAVEEADLEKKVTEFEPDRERLRSALRAANLEGEYAALNAMREQQLTDIGSLQVLKDSLPAQLAEKENCSAALENADKKYIEVKSIRESLLKLTGNVRLLDQEIAQKVLSADVLITDIETVDSERQMEIEKKVEVEKSIAALGSELENIVNYQTVNATDAILLSGFSGIRTTIDRLLDARGLMDDEAGKLEVLRVALKHKSEAEEKTAASLQAAILLNTSDKTAIGGTHTEILELLQGKSLVELTRIKDDLIIHLAGLKQIMDYESARTLLEDGKPCPLCGSIHHPFAEGNIPSSEEAEKELGKLITLLEEHNKLSQKLEKLVAAERSSGENLTTVKAQHELEIQQKVGIEIEIKNKAAELEKKRSSFDTISESLRKTLLPLGITEIPAESIEIEKFLQSLEKRRDDWKTGDDRRNEIDTLLQFKRSELAVIDTVINAEDDIIKSKTAEAEALQTAIEKIRSERRKIFGDKNADEEERLAAENLSVAETSKQQAADILGQKEQALAGIRARIADLGTTTTQRAEDIVNKTIEFSVNLNESKLENEEAFILARLTSIERTELEQKAKELDKKQSGLMATKRSKTEELSVEEAKKLTDESSEVLSEQLGKVNEEKEALIRETGVLTEKISANERLKIRGQEISARIDAQASIYERWSRLNALIGSADGKKYRNFAQGLTLDIMVSYANSQLAKLSDRYLLIRDKEEPLDLNVVDNYQAGEIRSTKNLSGGESFLVSLALALGLSRMASRKVRVDSLFLDEGFGTLDEETLETALGTLASLRQDGKMIGVISHIGAMKERINTKIIVQPVREGRSILTGPGCTRV